MLNADFRPAPRDKGAHSSRPLCRKLSSGLLTSALAACLALPAHATIDAALNTTNFVSGQASELSIDGVISQGGTSTSINCAVLMIRFDPAKVTLSGVRSGPNGWGLAASNTIHLAEGWMKAVLNNSSGDAGQGQTSSGPIMYFTVTPVDSSVTVNDCATLQLSGSESDLSDQDYETITPSDPCNGVYAPSGGPDPSAGSGPATKGGGTPMGPMSATIDLSSVTRILRRAAGLDAATATGNPNAMEFFYPDDPRLVNGTQDPRYRNGYYLHYPPLTTQDQATVEFADDKYWLLPQVCPPEGCQNPRLDQAWRHFTVADAIVALRVPFSGPIQGIWTMPFVGNWLETTGFAANATGAPAIADIDGDGTLDAVFPMGTRNGRNYPDPQQDQPGGGVSTNPNMVYAVSYNTTIRNFSLKNTWPQPLRDAAYGLSVGDILDSPGLEVVASNFQDTWRKSDGTLYAPQGSRPYVWTAAGAGTSIFADSGNPDRAVGVGLGHSNTAAPIFDADGDGLPEILFTSIGVYDANVQGEIGGGIKALRADGSLAFQTQETNDTAAWYTGTIPFAGLERNVAELNAPPVWMLAYGGLEHTVVAGAYSGDVFGWDSAGSRLFSAKTDLVYDALGRNKGHAVIDNAFAAGDVDNDGHSEIVVGTGRNLNYYDWDYDTTLRFNDGAIYCWSDTGGFLWRYPELHVPQQAGDWRPAYASGISLGHLKGPGAPLCIVAVDSSGTVVALDGSTGAKLWDYDIKPLANNTQKFQHLYLRGAIAQPLILDLNGDGYQDVIVGTTSGWIYILDGNPQATTRLLGKAHTFLSTQSVWRPNPETRIDNYVFEAPYEEVVGIAVGPLDPNHTNHAILLVTSSRAATSIEVPPVGGHATMIDLSQFFGGAATWDAGAADWPQFQQNPQRTGAYPGP